MKDEAKSLATERADRIVTALIEFVERAAKEGATAKEQEVLPAVADVLHHCFISGMLDSTSDTLIHRRTEQTRAGMAGRLGRAWPQKEEAD